MVLSVVDFLVIVLSTAVFVFVYRWVSPRICSKLFRRFGKLSRRDQIEWNERVVSSFHAIVAAVISTSVLVSDQHMQNNPVWGYSLLGKSILGFTLSYMAVDVVIMWSYFLDMVYFFHHFAAIFAYYVAIEANVLVWFACVRLTAEWSTVFVNARWHMQLLGESKNNKFYMLNGLFMVLSFFLCRIVPMPYFWYQVYIYYNTIPRVGFYTLILSCVILDTLNLWWMYRMSYGLLRTLGNTQFVHRIRHTLSRVVDDLNTLLVL